MAAINTLESAQNISVHAIPSLIKLLTFTDADVQEEASLALASICSTRDDAREAAYVAEAVPALVKLLASSGTVAVVLIAACRALGNICSSQNHIRAAAFTAGAVPALVLLLSHGDSEVRAAAVHPLHTTCLHEAAKADALRRDVIPILISLITSDNVSSYAHATFALAAINTIEEARVASVSGNAIPPLTKLLASKDTLVLEAACLALENISVYAPSRVAMQGAVPALRRLRSSANERTKRSALKLLERIEPKCEWCCNIQ